MNTTRPETPIKPNEQTLFNASAGSGKTFNLVYHFLYRTFSNYQKDKSAVPFRDLIAVTFTIKAAGEMRRRILQTLASFRYYGMEELSDTDQKMAELISAELEIKPDEFRIAAERILAYMTHFYNMVSVGTIDKFTHGVVRSFAQDLNLNPDFDVEMDAKMVLEKSVRQLISQVGRENSEEISDTLVQQVLEAVSEGKSWNVERLLNDEARSLISDVDRVYAAVLSEIPDVQWQKFIAELKTFISAYTHRAHEIGKRMSEIIRSAGLKPSDFSYKVPEKLIADTTSMNVRAIAEINTGPRFTKFKEGTFFSKASAKINEPLFEPHKQEFIELLEKIDQLVQDGPFMKFVQSARQSLNGLRFLGHVEKELEIIRQEENTVLISDFNRLIHENLIDQPEAFIYERIGERYHHYFIDEFQDTSQLQWENLLPLIENALSTNGTNMLVGDAKQSIYRFRGAEVSQFIGLATKESAYSSNNRGDKVERYKRDLRQLPKNYRSHQKIVAFNNHLIGRIAGLFENEPINDKDIAEVYRIGVQEPHHSKEGYVAAERFVFDDEKSTQDICNEYVLQKVRDAMSRGYSCRDIAVLTRKNKASSEIAVFLSQQEGLSVVSEDSLNTGNSADVKLILASMRYQRSPNEGVYQTQWIQWLFETKRIEWAQAQHAYRAIQNRKFGQWLDENDEFSLSETWIALPPIEWIDMLLDHFEIKTDAYVSKFVDEAFQFQRRAHEIQMHFVDYATENLSKWNIETASTADAITVSTIHKSKGLEYPIVIVPMVGWEMSSKYDRIWVKTEGIEPFNQLPFVKTSPSSIESLEPFQDAYRSWEKNNYMDHSNLLYVAFTRAECELYIGMLSPEFSRQYTNTASQVYGEFIESFHEFKAIEDGVFACGTKTTKAVNESPSKPTEEEVIKTSSVTHWRNRIRIAPKREKSWNVQRSDRDRGIVIHRILAETQTVEAGRLLLEEMRQSGEISALDFTTVSNTLESIWSSNEVKGIFNTENKIVNEQAILTPEGKNYRPDRILFSENQIQVIDFKTGEERNAHVDQIRKYGHLLEEMGYSNVAAELIYLSENEIRVKKINLH